MKLNNHNFEPKDWKEQAEALFFTEHLPITTIAEIIHRARETVSRHITNCEGYDEEMEFRRKQREAHNKKAKREYNHKYYQNSTITGESLRKEHETAVRILSSERFGYE